MFYSVRFPIVEGVGWGVIGFQLLWCPNRRKPPVVDIMNNDIVSHPTSARSTLWAVPGKSRLPKDLTGPLKINGEFKI
jgi:hypothetical protein